MEIDIYAMNTADWTVDSDVLIQLHHDEGKARIMCPTYLIDHPEGLVLFDTGLSYELVEEPEAYGSAGAPHMKGMVDDIEMHEGQKPTNRLPELGYDLSDINHVILSHLHMDHAGNITMFPEANFIVQKDELRYAWWPENPQWPFYLTGDFEKLRSPDYDVTPINGEYDIFGDGSLICFPTPGHTPGHQSLLIDREVRRSIILAADIAHVKRGYRAETPSVFNLDVSESVRSIQEVRHRAKVRNATVLLSHEPDDLEVLRRINDS